MINLLKNVFFLVLYKSTEILVPIIILPTIYLKLGAEDFGIFGQSLALSFFFLALSRYGFEISATKAISKNSYYSISSYIHASWLFAASLIIVAAFIIYLAPAYRDYKNLFLIVVGYHILLGITPIWYFFGKKLNNLLALSQIATRALIFIGVMIAPESAELFYYALLFFIGYLLNYIMLMLIIVLKESLSLFVISANETLKVIKEGFSIFITLSAPILYNNTTIFILSHVVDVARFGMFMIAYKLIEALLSGAQLLSTAFMPFIAKKSSIFRIYAYLSVLVPCFLIIAAFNINAVLESYSSIRFEENVYYYIAVLSFISLFVYIRISFGVNYLILNDFEKVYKNIILSCSLIGLAIALIFVPVFKESGAILVLLLTTFMMMLLTLFASLQVRRRGV